MPRVIISSGHTNANPGTVANGLREVDIARKIAKAIPPYLRSSGIISLTVPPELGVVQRIDWINKTGYSEDNNDVSVEIHINDGGGSGIEAWFEGDGSNNSQNLSQLITDATVAETGLAKVGAKSEYKHELGSLAFLHDSNPVTCLIEVGYIDNANDAKFLKSEQNIKRVARGIAKGILKYLGVEYKGGQPAGGQQSQNTQTSQPNTSIQAAGPVSPAIPPATSVTKRNQSTPVTTPAYTPPVSTPSTRITPAPTRPAAVGFNSTGGFPSPVRPGVGGAKPMPTREERKEMIKKSYVKILGREPNQNDLNYFLNIGISEDQLLKKMVDSQEHVDLVKSRQEVIKTKKNFNDQQTDLAQLKTQVEDQKKILMNLQNSIDQKNLALSQQQQRLNQFQKVQAAKGGQPNKPQQPSVEYKSSFLERLFKTFSDLFE
ncbi:MAG: N-acetylmuramoyl-L-alanine amidase [Candidatus Dojkabacteria bacterium]